MSIPDLDLTVRLVGLPLSELWGRYVAIGGTSTLTAFGERIAGTVHWSPSEDLFLAVALNDALIDASLGSLDPLEGLLQNHRAELLTATDGRAADDVWSPLRGGASCPDRIAADMDALIERSRATRSSARSIRTASQEVRMRIASTRDRPTPWSPVGQARTP